MADGKVVVEFCDVVLFLPPCGVAREGVNSCIRSAHGRKNHTCDMYTCAFFV